MPDALPGAATGEPVELREGQWADIITSDGWVIDQLALDRLHRRLSAAPTQVSAVAAETGALPPGSSYRVHAEHLALQPPLAVSETSERLPGVMLVRSDVAYDLNDNGVRVAEGSLLVDHGAHAHNPRRVIGTVRPATVLGRPPFPWRPVVVFLACESDPEVAEWARSIVNDLLALDIEGRLALAEPPPGLHLTQPCAPTEGSLAVLSPDIVVALDKIALEMAPVWCGDNRSSLVVELSGDVASHELVSWRVGQASGRLRARIGREIEPVTLARLVNRLCSGPLAFPPADAPELPVESPLAPSARAGGNRRRRPTRRRSVLVVTGMLDTGGRQRIEGLVDRAAAGGDTGEIVSGGTDGAPAASAADLVVLRGAGTATSTHALVEERRSAGLPTVVDLGPTDLAPNPDSTAPGVTLTPSATKLIEACGLVSVPTETIADAARALGARVHLVPTLITRSEAEDFTGARDQRREPGSSVVGWHVGSPGSPRSAVLEVVTEVVEALLESHPDLSLEVAGDPTLVSDRVLGHPNTRLTAGDPLPSSLARWTIQLWTPDSHTTALTGNVRPLVLASFAGVPTLLAEDLAHITNGMAIGELAVRHPYRLDEWDRLLRAMLDDPNERTRRSEQAVQRCAAQLGPVESVAIVDRFITWSLDAGGSA